MALNTILLTLATAGLALGAALEPRFIVGQTVQTNNGPITGQAASVANQVSEYLGIPFAQPPLGNLRFAAPVKYSGNTALTATRMSASCPALGTQGHPSIVQKPQP
jgi:carboxylesterase type B